MPESPSRDKNNGDLVAYSVMAQTPNSLSSLALPFVTTTAVDSPVATNLVASLAVAQVVPQHVGLKNQSKTSQLSLDSESSVK
jgi:hypothetical protein